MDSFQEHILHLAGPFLFAVAFSAFIMMADSLTDFVNTMQGALTEDEVYSEGDFGAGGGSGGTAGREAVVDGSYITGMICAGVTVNTVIIDETDHTHKFRISFDTKMMGSTYYTIEDTTLQAVKVEAQGSYSANTAFDYNVYIMPSAEYVMEHVYADTGIIDRIIFTRK